MSNFNWCHGPECHTRKTQDRVRGSKGSKVTRTRRISLNNEYIREGIRAYFCSQCCLYDFIRTHIQSIVAIAPRREPLETPIKVVKEKYESTRWDYNNGIENGPQQVPYMATRTTIKSVDND